MRSKIFHLFMVMLVVVPCVLLMTACGGVNPFADKDNGNNNGGGDNTTGGDTHICEECDLQHASDVMLRYDNLNIISEFEYTADDVANTASKYHYFNLPNECQNVYDVLKLGNIVIINYTIENAIGQKASHDVVNIISNASNYATANNTAYIADDSLSAGSAMMTTVFYRFERDNTSVYIKGAYNLKTLSNVKIKLNSITIYGDVAV